MTVGRLRLLLGKPIPPPPTLKPLALSAYSFSSADPEDTLIAEITGRTAGSVITIEPADGRLKLNVDMDELLIGAVESSTGTHDFDLVETLAGYANSPRRTTVSLTVTPASQTPILQDVTVPMGARTVPLMGSVFLRNLGLTTSDSPTVKAWKTGSVVAIGGGSAGQLTGLLSAATPSATARTPTVTNGALDSLATVNLTATSYEITVTAIGEDDSEATCTLTYEVVANAFNVGDDNATNRPDNMSTRIRPRLATKMGGLTWLYSVGADFSTGGGFFYDIAPTAPSRVAVQYADPARPSRLNGMEFRHCARVDVDGLGIGGAIANRLYFWSTSDDITVRNCFDIGSSFACINGATSGSPSDTKAINVAGATNITVEDCEFQWVGQFLAFNNVTNLTVRRNKCRYIHGDVIAIGDQVYTALVAENVFASFFRAYGTRDHIDGIQLRTATPNNQVSEDVQIVSNLFIQADGDTGMIGGEMAHRLSKRFTFKRNVVWSRTINAMQIHYSEDWALDENSWFLTASGKVANTTIENDNIYNGVQRVILIGTGSTFAGANRAYRCFSTGVINLTASPGNWTKSDCFEMQRAYSPEQFATGSGTYFEPVPGPGADFGGILKYADAYERSNNYHAVNNPNGFDYANATLDEIVEHVLDVMTPAAGGALDKGSYVIGAVNLDGTLKVAG